MVLEHKAAGVKGFTKDVTTKQHFVNKGREGDISRVKGFFIRTSSFMIS